MTKPKISLPRDVESSFNQSLTAIVEHHFAIERLTKDLRLLEVRLDRELEGTSKVIESQVRGLIGTARDFLSICRRDGRTEYVSHCLAAVDYLVNSEDAFPDFHDYDGFEDDLAVFEAVIKTFGLSIKTGKSAA